MTVNENLILLSDNGPFDLRHTQFSRRGSFLCVLEDDADRSLYISLSRSPDMWMQRKNLVRIVPRKNDIPVSCRYSVGIGKMTVESDGGTAEICFDRWGRMHIKTRGLGIGLEYRMLRGEHTTVIDRGCCEAAFYIIGKLRFQCTGGGLTVDDADAEGGRRVSLRPVSDADPDFTEWLITEDRADPSAVTKQPVEAFSECAEDAERDFREYLSRYGEKGDFMRILAAWVVWTHTVGPKGNLKHEVVYMTRTQWLRAFGWQQSFHSMAISGDAAAAWEMIRTMFDYPDPAGQLPDSIGDIGSAYMVTKPALQGLALAIWLKRYDIAALPRQTVRELYDGFAAFAGWWLGCRDRNRSGIPQYYHGDESPGEFCSCFRPGVPMYSGDLLAFLILLTEGASRLAGVLGETDAAAAWERHSQRLLSILTDDFWNGNGFAFRQAGTGETAESGAYMCLLPIILGKRLPECIIRRITERLTDESEYLTPDGISIEHLREAGDLSDNPGPKGAPVFVSTLMAMGLSEAGQTEAAKEIAARACGNMDKNGFVFMHFGGDGPDDNKPVDRWTSWSASCYIILSDLPAAT